MEENEYATGAGRVLVVDDDETVCDVVRRYLELSGYQVFLASNGEQALKSFTENRPDIIVLDLMLPGITGLEICRQLRAQATTPIVMLTALSEEEDRILGLELGADDYVTKPFSPRELVLRVTSVLRRARMLQPPGRPERLADGDLRLDVVARQAWLRGKPLTLTLREIDLLEFFLSYPGKAFTREELLDKVWNWTFGDHSTVTVHIRRLREKIEDNPTKPRRITTVWGVGYRYDKLEK